MTKPIEKCEIYKAISNYRFKKIPDNIMAGKFEAIFHYSITFILEACGTGKKIKNLRTKMISLLTTGNNEYKLALVSMFC